MKRIILAFAALSLITIPASVEAAPCKDAKGKFVKCPTKAAPPKRCRSAKGAFIKCPK